MAVLGMVAISVITLPSILISWSIKLGMLKRFPLMTLRLDNQDFSIVTSTEGRKVSYFLLFLVVAH
jgi:hypothetical protein